MTNNVLAMFQDCRTSKLVQFNCVERIGVNIPQEVLQVQIVDIDGNVQNINGLAVIDIWGKVSLCPPPTSNIPDCKDYFSSPPCLQATD